MNTYLIRLTKLLVHALSEQSELESRAIEQEYEEILKLAAAQGAIVTIPLSVLVKSAHTVDHYTLTELETTYEDSYESSYC